jgi:putative tryptophan/tyrosine transport system substrate-binding protein
VIGILVNPKFPDAQSQSRDVQAAARLVGQQIHIIGASSERELDAVSDALDQQRARGLIVTVDPFLNLHRDQITTSLRVIEFLRCALSVNSFWLVVL